MFGIYHTDCSKDEKRFEELAGSDFVNVFLVEGNYLEKVFSDNFELLKPHPDKGVFVSVSYLGFRTRPARPPTWARKFAFPRARCCPILRNASTRSSDFSKREDIMSK